MHAILRLKRIKKLLLFVLQIVSCNVKLHDAIEPG